MNDAKLQFDKGNLGGAVESAINLVKTNPTSVPGRIFLFELSCFSGDWDRAQKQLDVIGHQDANAMVGSVIYRQNFKAEQDRMKLFSEGLKPECMAPLPPHVEDLLQATSRVREGNTSEAREIIDRVEEERPAYPCTVNGEAF